MHDLGPVLASYNLNFQHDTDVSHNGLKTLVDSRIHVFNYNTLFHLSL